MALQQTSETTLPGVVAGMAAALLKTYPSRNRVHDRSAVVWGDMDSFAADAPSTPAGTPVDFAEMI